MTSLPAEPAPWPRRRWLGTLTLIFLLQLVLIFGLSEHGRSRPRQPGPSPALQLVANPPAELLALTDPTLFALPHRHGFAGLAWLKEPRLEFHSADLSEPSNCLALDPSHLGAAFYEFSETNLFSALPVPTLPEPDLVQPYFASMDSPRSNSTWRVEGDLARRRIISSFKLPPWAHTELLTNTVVQVVVDAGGKLVSVPLLLASSTYKPADDYALEQARSLRFESATGGGQGAGSSSNGLAWGKIIFEWSTIPTVTTNAPSAPSQP